MMYKRVSLERDKEIRKPSDKSNHPLKPDDTRAAASPPTGSDEILRMQQTHGNAYVRRHLAQLKSGHADNAALVRRAPAKPAPGAAPSNETPPPAYITMTVGGAELRGSSKRPGHEGKIEALSYSLGPAKSTTGSGEVDQKETEKKEQPIVLSFSKYVDDLSPVFAQLVNEGTPVDFRLEAVKGTGDQETVYMTFDFKKAIITSVQIVGSAAVTPTEYINLAAAPKDASITVAPPASNPYDATLDT